MKTAHAIVLVVAILVLASPTTAQVTTAGIFGTVTDRSGAVVAGADVTVVNTETNFTRTTKSEANGEYSFKALPLGPYRSRRPFRVSRNTCRPASCWR